MFRAKAGVDDPVVKKAMSDVFAKAVKIGGALIGSPYAPGGERQTSRQGAFAGKAAFASVALPRGLSQGQVQKIGKGWSCCGGRFLCANVMLHHLQHKFLIGHGHLRSYKTVGSSLNPRPFKDGPGISGPKVPGTVDFGDSGLRPSTKPQPAAVVRESTFSDEPGDRLTRAFGATADIADKSRPDGGDRRLQFDARPAMWCAGHAAVLGFAKHWARSTGFENSL